jgi:predicted HAD superfamily Cof-like phosphohydrolase
MTDSPEPNSSLAAACLVAQGFARPERPTLEVDARLVDLWPRLLTEEVTELDEALRDRDLIGVADALADVLYVAYQGAASFGLPIDELFGEVHRSNLTKVPADGEAVRRADGKVLKPDSYRRPDLGPILGLKP